MNGHFAPGLLFLVAQSVGASLEDADFVIQAFDEAERDFVFRFAIAWLNRCRRLAKDWENLNRKALAFLRLASSQRTQAAAFPSRLSQPFVYDLAGEPIGSNHGARAGRMRTFDEQT
jgi:hypothetical protein